MAKSAAQLNREIAESLARAAEAKLAAIARTRRPTPEESAEAIAAYGVAAKATGARKKPRATHAKTPVKTKAKPPLRVAYRLQLSPSELRAVEFARGRYLWPDMLAAHASETGAVGFTESEMWQWTDDVDSDTEGGHSPFPLASGAFADKLQGFYDERI